MSHVAPLPSGFFVQSYTAEVDDHDHFMSIGVHEFEWWHFDPTLPDPDAWTRIGTGTNLLVAGVDTSGRVIGSVFSDAGRALVAYDVATDRLLVSDTACVWDDYPTLVTGDTVWLPGWPGSPTPIRLLP